MPGLSLEESDPLRGDAIDQTLTWQGRSDLKAAGDMAAISLRLFDAKVFAYRV